MQHLLDSLQIIFFSLASIFVYTNLKQEYLARKALIESWRMKRKKLENLRQIYFSAPLGESNNLESFPEGLEDYIEILKTALSGKAPCHIIIYGIPGSLGSLAARLAMNSASASENSPFAENSPFIELNAAAIPNYDMDSAEPFIGAVIEPSNPFTHYAIPHIKGGAVTKAHGGILFIDKIDRLHYLQAAKLSLVLKERKVRFESTYYSPCDKRIPMYLHDVFQNGLPADFCLIAITDKDPQDIPEDIRSRCLELHFTS